jgi:hypothetical protein
MSHTIAHTDDLDREGSWLLARRTLGVRSFGINVVDVPPGGELPAHDETDPDQEEVYLVLAGRPPSGSAGRARGARRHVRAAGSPSRSAPSSTRTETARLLMVSAPMTSGFAPMEWA